MRNATLASALTVLVVTGCGPGRPVQPAVAVALRAPNDVVAAHNAWADSVAHIWSRADLTVNFPSGEPGGKRMQHDLAGHLFLEKPDRLFVHGQVMGREVFSLGMNAERFWLWIRPEVNTVWTGSRGGAGERRLVLSPPDLMTALGLFRIDLSPDAPALFVAQARHYVLAEHRLVGERLVPSRRVWFDRATLRPVRVDLFDETGGRLLMAELMAYERVGETDVCTTYRVRFHSDAEVVLVLRLNKVDLAKTLDPRVYEYRQPPGAEVHDLDWQPGADAP